MQKVIITGDARDLKKQFSHFIYNISKKRNITQLKGQCENVIDVVIGDIATLLRYGI